MEYWAFQKLLCQSELSCDASNDPSRPSIPGAIPGALNEVVDEEQRHDEPHKGERYRHYQRRAQSATRHVFQSRRREVGQRRLELSPTLLADIRRGAQRAAARRLIRDF